MNKELANKIKNLAKDIGFTDCGITTIEPFNDYKNAVKKRIEQFPEAAFLYEKMLRRAEPASFHPWARSIIVCLRRYGKYELPKGVAGFIGRNYLCDRRYSGSPDHDMPKKMKQGLINMGLRVKRGGIPDRHAGARAGVTSFGKNSFAYSKDGSWINIETWMVDIELLPDKPSFKPICPENCSKCIDACPTKALVEPFVMRWDLCIAYLTYEAPEPVALQLWEKMGKWIYGCDICEEVCPLNKGKWQALEDASWINDIAPYLQVQSLAEMTQETFEKIIHPRFWYIPLDNLARWHKNAKRALKSLNNIRFKE